MTPEQTALSAILIASAFAFFVRVALVVRAVRRGTPERWWDKLGARVRNVIVYGIFQRKVYRDPYAGFLHAFIFWAFVVLLLSVVETVAEGYVEGFRLPLGPLSGPLYLAQDVVALLGTVGVAMAIWRRLVTRPARLQHEGSRAAVAMLLFILAILQSFLFLNAARIVEDAQGAAAAWRPHSAAGAGLLSAAGLTGAAPSVESAMWWTHIVALFAFLAWFPYTKHAHILFAMLNVFFRRPEPPGILRSLPPLRADSLGARTVEDLSWTSLLNAFACTECGRCTEACPAHASGGAGAMAPMHLMMRLRDAALSRGPPAPAASAALTPAADPPGAPALLPPAPAGGDLFASVHSPAALWTCMACLACTDACPVLNDHLTKIVQMRRRLVADGNVEEGLRKAFVSLSRYGNSFDKTPKARAKWVKKTASPPKDARKEAVEYLWFVGDFASYDPRCEKLTVKTAEIFSRLGLDVGILFEDEKNSGNDARRAGEEGLFEILREQNRNALDGRSFRAIVTTDPHSYHTLKNEFAGNGHPVLHHTELLDERLRSGQLTFSRKLSARVTFHDPCYLGRYNGVFDAPRKVLEATGLELVEMPRNRQSSFCCGAGGGRIWMEEPEGQGERPAEMRVKEAAALDGVGTLVTACPKDYVMFTGAVKAAGLEGRLQVRDLVELVEEAL